MLITFPKGFFWGTSTAAAQVETAFDHPWRGVRASDGHIFERTTDHEKRRMEDAEFIVRLGSIYRCSVDWGRLQRGPFAKFDKEVVEEYCSFFERLRKGGAGLMFVLHHFAHPNWFEQQGGWTKEDNIPHFLDFVRQCVKHFGEYVRYWNTFNEPNVYAMNAFWLGHFPPFKKRQYFTANRVLDNMGKAHLIARTMIREKLDAPVGISLNTARFEGLNILGRPVAAFARWWFMERAARPFKKCDYWGLSYYAYVPFDPFPLDAIHRRPEMEQRNIPHDKMWGYDPQGLGQVLRFFHQKYGKPIIVTENGICTDDAPQRIKAIKDYLHVCHAAMQEDVPLLGYIHWSTWDNFEWHLGPTYRFGLVRVDFETMERAMTEAGLFYEQVVRDNAVEV
ncbi:MAG: family 1 glycosylhydrolase [Saprospiraceae bacterium]|nr:family 1 glycosylhydrolase [Saprospiraceae bacterium]